MKKIVILGGARDYHVMDWYRTIRKLAVDRDVVFLTDLIDSEGYDYIVEPGDNIECLFVIDKLLFSTQSRMGNIWRNVLKFLVLPLQIIKLRRFSSKQLDAVYHTQSMYYMLLCWLAGVEYIGTPQGSEILVRPQRSRLLLLA